MSSNNNKRKQNDNNGGAKRAKTEYPEFVCPDNLSPAECMERYGVAVIPLMGAVEAAAILEEIKAAIRASPFLKQETVESFLQKISNSRFGASSLPDVFHCKPVRDLRERVAQCIRDCFRGYRGATNYLVAHDRLCHRPVGTEISAEAMHRDIDPSDGEFEDPVKRAQAALISAIFGGWVALQREQCITLCPGTHHDDTGALTGFVKIEGAELERTQPLRRRVCVPVGSLVIFYQKIAHVVPRTVVRDEDMWRMFVGVYLLKAPLIPNWHNVQSCLTGAAPHLPSGQIAPMWDKMHKVGKNQDQTRAFSEHFVDALPRDNTGFIPRELRAPAEYGLPNMHPYSAEELARMLPRPF